MAIFNSTATFETVNVENIIPTEECSYEFIREANEYMYKLVGGMYVSDILIESTEGIDVEAVAEATVKEVIEKAIAKLKEWKNKFVAWIKRVWENIKIMFMNAEKFAKKYEKELIDKAKKAAGEVEYTGYDYNTGVLGMYDDLTKNLTDVVSKGIPGGKAVSFDERDPIADVLSKFGSGDIDNLADLKEHFTAKIRGGDVTDDIKITPSVAQKMIDLCKNHRQIARSIENVEAATKKTFDAAIKGMDSIKTNADGTESKIVSYRIKMYNQASSISTAMSTHCVGMVKEIYKAYGSALKKLWRFKPAKESYVASEDDSSILESALKMI